MIYHLATFFVITETHLREKINNNNESDFKNYTLELELEPAYSEIMFIDSYSRECANIVEDFFKRFVDNPKIIYNSTKIGQKIACTKNPEYIIVFIKNAPSFTSTLSSLLQNLWFNRANIQFVICEPLIELHNNYFMLEAIWRENIFNFVLIFKYDKLYVRSINKFSQKRILELTAKPKNVSNMFPKKLRNVHGFKFRVGVASIKKTGKVPNEIITAKDKENLDSFFKYINGTIQIVKLGHEHKSFEWPSIHFSFIRQFPSLDILNEVEFVTPCHKNSLVGLVPKAELISPYNYFFMLFDYYSVLSFIGILILVALIAGLENNFLFLESFFEAIRIFLGGSVPKFSQKPISTKIMFVSFMVSVLLGGVIFNTSLTTLLLTKKYNKNIDSISDLTKSNLTIFVSREHYHLLPSSIQNKTLLVSQEILFTMISQGFPNAYITLESLILVILQMEDDDIPRKVSRTFHVMKDTIVPGYNMYVFPKNSPYVDEISRFFRIYDTLTSKVLLEDYITYQNCAQLFNKIQWVQWKSIFSILIIGYFISFIIFLLELLIKKFSG